MTEQTRKELNARGFNTVEEYLEDLADEFGVALETVQAVFCMMGESELFDGVASALEDAAAMRL